ncbi:DUF6063 family protein [uncultured Robinsoniella sp.]|uniref:DUF6063 family protein n=1 Tax=uncultured Robinsoniella sp. TaxID=904190 RepID=UPI00374E2DF7
MLKQALAIYNRLLENGEIDAKTDSELYVEYKNEEVREILEQFSEELDFRILDTGNTIYMIPNLDNDVLGYVMKDFRENIATNAKLVDAYLQCYICMMIFQLFYGGKNTNPIQREFIQTKDLIEALDQKMEGYLTGEEETLSLEKDYGINFYKIAQLWQNKQIGDSVARKSKLGTLARAYAQLEHEKLIRVLEEGREIRRTRRMDDLFLYYYLDEARVQEIHQLFSQGDKINAED